MSAFRTISAVTVLIAFLLSVRPLKGQDASTPPKRHPSEESIPRLIEQLGSRDFQERQAARKRLAKRDDAIPALKKAMKSSDLEVRLQAKVILEEIDARMKQRAAERVLARIQHRGIDRFIDEVCIGDAGQDDAVWRGLLLLANQLAEKASKENKVKVVVPQWDYFHLQHLKTDNLSNILASTGRYIVNRLTPQLVDSCFVVCRGSIIGEPGTIGQSIVFTNGDIRLMGEISGICNSIVFCDGDVVIDGAANCLIIATGKIKRGKAKRDDGVIAIENAGQAHGILTFFDVSAVGLELATKPASLQVRKVRDGSVFARAGVQEGDRIIAIDKTDLTTPDALRKAVRRLLVEKKKAVLKVKRGNRTVELPIDFSRE